MNVKNIPHLEKECLHEFCGERGRNNEVTSIPMSVEDRNTS